MLEKEKLAEKQIRDVIAAKGRRYGGDYHRADSGRRRRQSFSAASFCRHCARFATRMKSLLIFDEVQCGMGITGKNWCCEHFGVLPDLLAFGKKAQVCGVMAGPRLDEVKDNCFRLAEPNQFDWGGNFTDYVRSTHYLRIVEEGKSGRKCAGPGQKLSSRNCKDWRRGIQSFLRCAGVG